MFKPTTLSKLILPVLFLGLLLAVGAGLALAGQPDNAEGGQDAPLDKTLSGNDEEVTQSATPQSADPFQLDGEGQVEVGQPLFITEELELQVSQETAQTQLFERIAGSNFAPRHSATTYSYSGGGCMQRDANTGDSWFTINLALPQGAVVDFMRVYYYDDNGSFDVNSELWAFDGAGGTELLAEADSSGTPGYSSTGSDFFAHTVDHLSESLVVVASIQGGVGSDLQLCGVRIRYQYSAFTANFLPAVIDDTAAP